jgi:hypothetical protein
LEKYISLAKDISKATYPHKGLKNVMPDRAQYPKLGEILPPNCVKKAKEVFMVFQSHTTRVMLIYAIHLGCIQTISKW